MAVLLGVEVAPAMFYESGGDRWLPNNFPVPGGTCMPAGSYGGIFDR